MAKTFYTERDIDDLHARGVTSIDVNDDVVLTDLARERMFKYGMLPKRVDSHTRPAIPQGNGAVPIPAPVTSPVVAPLPVSPVSKELENGAKEVLIHRIKAAVMARLNNQVDPVLLDTVVRRVMADMK
jgi:hypothetical protein